MMRKKIRLPFIVWVVVISTIIACIGGKGILGYRIAGLGWFIPLVVSLLILAKKPGGMKFPVLIWLPWICIVIIYLSVATDVPNALQRSIILLCPIIVGMAVSQYSITEQAFQSFKKLYHYLAIALLIVVGFKSGLLITGALPKTAGLAAEVMTGALLCSLYASRYALGEKKAMIWWGALAAIPVIALTRMGIAAAGVTLPLTFAPLKRFKRVFIIILIGVIELGVFYMPRTQEKMFYSGQGTLAELRMDNPNFATTGRKVMWDMMKPEIKEEPLFGHGANADENFVFRSTGIMGQPHNDWMRLLYDYGYIGTIIFGFCIALQFFHALKRAKRTTGETRILFYAGASSFLAFVLFMFSDNIILYAAFFGNLQFTILGLAYAALKNSISPEGGASFERRRPRIKIRF
ncbi:MAG: O-antigen ligase family protein [Thermodesulfovibrionales bacterium]